MNILSNLKGMILKLFTLKGTVGFFGLRKDVPLPVILIVLLAVVGYYLTRYQLHQGQWNTFVSDRYSYTIDYPANWSMNAFGDGGSRGSIYRRSLFGDFLTGYSVNVHEQRMEKPDLWQAATWGEEIINRLGGYNWSDLEETEVGQGNYPALVRTYTRNNIFGLDPEITKVVYIVTAHHAFALEFEPYERSDDESKAIYDYMLDSFRITTSGE